MLGCIMPLPFDIPPTRTVSPVDSLNSTAVCLHTKSVVVMATAAATPAYRVYV